MAKMSEVRPFLLEEGLITESTSDEEIRQIWSKLITEAREESKKSKQQLKANELLLAKFKKQKERTSVFELPNSPNIGARIVTHKPAINLGLRQKVIGTTLRPATFQEKLQGITDVEIPHVIVKSDILHNLRQDGGWQEKIGYATAIDPSTYQRIDPSERIRQQTVVPTEAIVEKLDRPKHDKITWLGKTKYKISWGSRPAGTASTTSLGNHAYTFEVSWQSPVIRDPKTRQKYRIALDKSGSFLIQMRDDEQPGYLAKIVWMNEELGDWTIEPCNFRVTSNLDLPEGVFWHNCLQMLGKSGADTKVKEERSDLVQPLDKVSAREVRRLKRTRHYKDNRIEITQRRRKKK